MFEARMLKNGGYWPPLDQEKVSLPKTLYLQRCGNTLYTWATYIKVVQGKVLCGTTGIGSTAEWEGTLEDITRADWALLKRVATAFPTEWGCAEEVRILAESNWTVFMDGKVLILERLVEDLGYFYIESQ